MGELLELDIWILKAPENLKINSKYQILKEKRAKEKKEKMLRKETNDEKTNLKKDK